jgi:hypothetical protein
MLVAISAEFPKEIEAAAKADLRATFRKSLENRLRPRMEALVDRIKHDAHYQSIAPFYELEQKSTADEVAFAVINTNPHSQYLIGGTAPHVIQQRPHMVPLSALMAWSGGDKRVAQIAQARIAQRGVTIHHPGTKKDEPVLADIAIADQPLLVAAQGAIDAWANKLGAEVIP